MLESAKNEIVQEFREKLSSQENKVKLEKQIFIILDKVTNLPDDLLFIISNYYASELEQYSDQEILDNIIEIRKLLGQLPCKQAQQQIHHPAQQRAADGGAAELFNYKIYFRNVKIKG